MIKFLQSGPEIKFTLEAWQSGCSEPDRTVLLNCTPANILPPPPYIMSFASILSLLFALILSFTVLSAGIARLGSPITPEQIAQERNAPFISASTRRELVGVLDILCGIMLLVPRSRKLGAAVAFGLLVVGLISRVREGKSLGKTLICMGLCVIVSLF